MRPITLVDPSSIGQSVPTYAGHPESRLVKDNGVRFIFHTATVRVDAVASQESLTWIETDGGIRQAVSKHADAGTGGRCHAG